MLEDRRGGITANAFYLATALVWRLSPNYVFMTVRALTEHDNARILVSFRVHQQQQMQYLCRLSHIDSTNNSLGVQEGAQQKDNVHRRTTSRASGFAA